LLRTRVLTGLALAVIVGVSIIWLPTEYAGLVFGLFWFIGAGEWARIAGLHSPGRTVFCALFAVFVGAVIRFGIDPRLAAALFWLAAACWIAMFIVVLRYPQPLARTPILAIGLVVLAAAWLAVYLLHGRGAAGPGLILAGLIIVWSADIGAFFVGRSIGRTPLAPRVSPKKTWEGVGGGVLLAAIAGFIAARVLELPLAFMVPAAVAMALISVVGDLGISVIKRRAGIKDSGMLLPGHGGVLDRFDSVTAALPFYALALQFAHVLD
jgi:phosphatidate cytidylyltransferase